MNETWADTKLFDERLQHLPAWFLHTWKVEQASFMPCRNTAVIYIWMRLTHPDETWMTWGMSSWEARNFISGPREYQKLYLQPHTWVKKYHTKISFEGQTSSSNFCMRCPIWYSYNFYQHASPAVGEICYTEIILAHEKIRNLPYIVQCRISWNWGVSGRERKKIKSLLDRKSYLHTDTEDIHSFKKNFTGNRRMPLYSKLVTWVSLQQRVWNILQIFSPAPPLYKSCCCTITELNYTSPLYFNLLCFPEQSLFICPCAGRLDLAHVIKNFDLGLYWETSEHRVIFQVCFVYNENKNTAVWNIIVCFQWNCHVHVFLWTPQKSFDIIFCNNWVECHAVPKYPLNWTIRIAK